MTRTRITVLDTLLVGLLSTTACRDPLPCPDCGNAEDGKVVDMGGNDGHEAPLPDLPCGGADLMTDNLNCGTCGHECVIWGAGSTYEAGSCSAGVCGPGWTHCIPGAVPKQDCTVVCEALGQNCVSNGCAGYTGLLYEGIFGDVCDIYEPPVATMKGGCDEPIPWESTGDFPREVMCCCDFQ